MQLAVCIRSWVGRRKCWCRSSRSKCRCNRSSYVHPSSCRSSSKRNRSSRSNCRSSLNHSSLSSWNSTNRSSCRSNHCIGCHGNCLNSYPSNCRSRWPRYSRSIGCGGNRAWWLVRSKRPSEPGYTSCILLDELRFRRPPPYILKQSKLQC